MTILSFRGDWNRSVADVATCTNNVGKLSSRFADDRVYYEANYYDLTRSQWIGYLWRIDRQL